MGKKIKKGALRQTLLNGCYYTQFAVHPENWEDAGADPNCEWYFSYRFYDPLFKDKKPYGKQVQVKGTNDLTGLTAKRQMMRHFLANEKHKLEVEGYNCFTKQNMKPPIQDLIHYEIHPDLPIKQALQEALNKIKVEPDTKICLKSVLKHCKIAIDQLRYDILPIGQTKRAHVKRILEQVGQNKGAKWTANNFNHYRSHLSMLFSELIEWETIDYNPIDKISKMEIIRRKREILTMDQRQLVYEYLCENNFRFWILMNIFYLAGCRRTEIVKVQAKNVDMENQKFKATVKKGKGIREVEYTITDSAVPFWTMALNGAQPEDYVFSIDLKPGPHCINPKQITRRWMYWIKGKLNKEQGLNITADWYSLKHMHSTEIVSLIGRKAAADFNNESEKMIEHHYDVLADERKHLAKKQINTRFLPTSVD